MGGPVKVLYISALGRSGSTILGNTLEQLGGWFHAGEIVDVWQYGLRQNLPCGCGRPFRTCRFWRTVLEGAYGRAGPAADDLLSDRLRFARHWFLPLMMTPSGRSWFRARCGRYLEALEALYPAVAGAAGARVIVDTSKAPGYLYFVAMLPSTRVYVLHLVRDPRGAAYSWGRRVVRPETGTPMHRYSVIQASVRWVYSNLFAEVFARRDVGRYMRLRYEDFVARPRDTLRRILGFIEEPDDPLEFVRNGTVSLGSNHTVWGNPNRHQTGAIPLRQDTRWRQAMPGAEQALCGLLTLPAAIRYRRSAPAL